MTTKPSLDRTDAILAAGGIVLGLGENSGKIALVRRRRYEGEVALPKGKLREGEDAIEAALREVKEETGLTAPVREYGGATHYRVGPTPKAVFYFVMDMDRADHGPPADTEEIAVVEWFTPSDAVQELTHLEDKDLISAVFGVARERRQ